MTTVGDPLDSREDYGYSDDTYDETDDELDWDPDRERLLRFVRRKSHKDGHDLTVARCEYGSDRQKSLAERRTEWREARGLARQPSIAERARPFYV